MKVYVEPRFDFTQDVGEGGVKQVIGHVVPHLEALGVEFVDDRDAADVVWYHAAPYAQTRVWLEKRPGVAVVCSNHGLYWAEYQWDAGSLAANAEVIEGMRLADVVTVPSRWVANAVNRGISADVRVVYHGVDLAEFAPAPGEPGAYALYDKTRVDPVCDPTPVIELARRMPDQKFVMTGDPPVDLPNVLKLGRIPYEQARALTRGAGVYLAVVRETFGLATLQAMAAGVPVVGYRYGGQAEILGSEHNGGLVSPGDVDGLAAAVRWALEERADLSVEMRERAAEFTWQKAASAYYEAFLAAIEAHASPTRVTVITTAYNTQRTVARTLASVAAALGPDDEYVVVDDASTDDTRAIVEGFVAREPRARLIAREENGYLAQARNDALAVARGRYVACVDADDELTPDALNVLAGELDKDRTTQVAYGKIRFLDDFPQENGTIESRPADYRQWNPSLNLGESDWPFPFDWGIQSKGDNVTCMPYSTMVRTEWLRRSGGWRTRCRTGEDIDLWMRLVSTGVRPRMVTQADCLIYHTSTSSMSMTNRLPDWGKWFPWTGAAGKRSHPPFGLPFPPSAAMNASWPISHHEYPVVSVIIPVGPGHDRYVLDAVDSVAAQTFRRWECVVVNDTGHELGVRLPGWVIQPEGVPGTSGVSAARNAGLRAATAPYVVFLDADDYLDRDALEHLAETITRHPELAVVYPEYWERVARPQASGAIEYDYRAHELPDWDCERGILPGAIYGVTAIYRREAIDAVGGFDEAAPGWEDGDLQVALSYAGYCAARLPRRLYVYSLDHGGRRAENLAREPEVIEWFRAKYAGRESMACRSCGGGPVRVSSPVISDGAGDAVILSGGMTEVQYTGDMQGAFNLRGGASGTFYTFGAGKHSRKPVLNEDLGFFDANPDYQVLREGAPQPLDAPPTLTIDGPPSGRRAAVA